MLDDGVVLVALDHADLEEAAIFLIGHRLEDAFARVAVVLRPLDQGDFGRGEERQRPAQPERFDLVVAVDHRDIDRCGIGQPKRLVERPGLEPDHVVVVEEAEPLAQRRAMRLDRRPGRRVRRVVVQHDDFEIVVVEARQRIQRRHHHGRRLVVAGHVDRDARAAFRNRGAHGATVDAP
ncbi:MAG: hypothetical protein WDN03_14750 [Rhizomicrobium sp.]